MTKYILFKKSDPSEVIGRFDRISDAQDHVVDNDLPIFDYDIRPEEVSDINEVVTDFKSACEYLHIKPDFKIEVADKKHQKAVEAYYQLCVIAEAWNKADGFVPDWTNGNQWKYCPYFVFKKGGLLFGGASFSGTYGGFLCAYSPYSPSNSYANFGSRLCFKSSDRARQFGNQFVSLINDMMLVR